MTDIDSTIPKHVGIILDGNRRWAQAQGLPAVEGHRRGAEVFKDIALAAFERGIQYVSAFVFSTENWQRTEEEVSYLMRLVVKATEKYLDEFHQRGIKVVIVGKRDKISQTVLESIQKTEEKTKNNTSGCLAMCFNYGGQQEIADAVSALIAEHGNTKHVTPELIEHYLYSPEIPSLDLLIRTSGEQRTSGFMLWRAAYAELLFIKKLWPDFTVDDLGSALEEYKKRSRRFGG